MKVLQAANAHQVSTDGKKSDWVIRENITDRVLWEFNSSIADADVFDILHFARAHETIAFDEGVEFQLGRSQVDIARLEARHADEVRRLKDQVSYANHRIGVLADEVQKLQLAEK